MKKVAVVLCGAGYLDGSEIREAVGVLWALSAEGASVTCFAPDEPQYHVVNCLTGKPAAGEKRNQQVESARIARGLVEPLSKLKASDFNALIIPGGFGAAQNLCSFAHKGSSGEVQEDLKHALQGFHAAGKPIGAVCIAPAVVALAFPKKGFELTVGEACEASQEIEKLGHRHFVTKAKEWHTDTKNKIVSTPAYMFDTAPLHEIFEGIRGLVRDVLKLT